MTLQHSFTKTGAVESSSQSLTNSWRPWNDLKEAICSKQAEPSTDNLHYETYPQCSLYHVVEAQTWVVHQQLSSPQSQNDKRYHKLGTLQGYGTKLLSRVTPTSHNLPQAGVLARLCNCYWLTYYAYCSSTPTSFFSSLFTHRKIHEHTGIGLRRLQLTVWNNWHQLLQRRSNYMPIWDQGHRAYLAY